MKISLILFTAASMYFIAACNNGSESSIANADTDTTQTSTLQDTAIPDNGLIKAMDDMMAKMQSMKISGDFDIDFANMMIEHHQGALDMAQVEMSQGSDEKMKSMAQKIITKQKEEQEILKDFVKDYKSSSMKHGEGELQKSMSDIINKMKSMQMSSNIDKDFATMMVSHHEDGISMFKMELKNGMSDKLKQMAQKGITDQTKEISEFKAWMSKN